MRLLIVVKQSIEDQKAIVAEQENIGANEEFFDNLNIAYQDVYVN